MVPALARGEAPRAADASIVAYDNGFRDESVELALASAQCTGVGRLTVTLRPNAAVKHWKRALKATATLTLGSARSSRAITLAGGR